MKNALRARHAGVHEIAALIRGALKDKKEWERGSLDGLSSEMFKIGG